MKLRKLKKKPKKQPVTALRDKAIKYQQTKQLQKSATCYLKILAHSPKDAEILNDLGTIYYLQGKYQKATSCYKKATSIKPNLPQAYYNMGNIYAILNLPEEAIFHYQKAIELNPSNLDAINNMGNILYDQGEVEKAAELFNKALKFAPDNHQKRSIVISSQNYISHITPAQNFALASNWWKIHGKPIYRKTVYRNSPLPHRKLKIGFISPDFKEHSIAYFFLPLVTHINHTKIETTCYSDTLPADHITEKISSISDHWRETHTYSDPQLTRLVEKDKIDILVDLCGHMNGNRLMVFARQPAPIQLSWLGYPNTTGLSTIHYRLTDEMADPTGSTDEFYAERLIRMPNGFLCYSPPEECPEIKVKNDLDQTVTFASFNNPAKMSPETIAIWASILTKLPESTLLLKGKLLDNDYTKKTITNKFKERGVSPGQIAYLPFSKSTKDHLHLYNRVDVCLDPLPYNGTTTTCEALWMGVPVITMLGKQHASRVTASILNRIGLPELITHSKSEYIDTAIRVIQDIGHLQEWRKTLRSRMQDSALCNARNFAKEMEAMFQQIWSTWCKAI